MQVPYFQVRRAKKRRPFHERELIYTVSEIARTLLVTPQSVYRYRRVFPDFPKLITAKAAVTNWARTHGIPMRRGPLPSEIRRVVVRLRGEGRTFREIGQVSAISYQAAHQHYQRHLNGLE
jgi:hypothetical protein